MQQEYVDTIQRQYKKLKISEKQLARIIELWQINQDADEALDDMMDRVKPIKKCGHLAIRSGADYLEFVDTAEWKACQETFKDLADYIANLPRSKQYDLDCIMNLGRNIAYYGVCEETVKDFEIRVDERAQEHEQVSSEYYAGKRPLGKWIKAVQELVNGPVCGTLEEESSQTGEGGSAGEIAAQRRDDMINTSPNVINTSPKYVGSYTNDGLLNIVYQVHDIIGDVYVLEAISYLDLISIIASGSEPSDEIVVEQIREMKISDIENPRLFYSWMGIAGEFIRAEKARDKEERLQAATTE